LSIEAKHFVYFLVGAVDGSAKKLVLFIRIGVGGRFLDGNVLVGPPGFAQIGAQNILNRRFRVVDY